MKTLTIDHTESLLHQLRQMGIKIADFPVTVQARRIQPEVHRPIHIASTATPTDAIFWVDSDGRPVVDENHFSTLNTALLPMLGQGQSVEVGHWKRPTDMSPFAVTELLIRRGVILTYVHIGSELCVTPSSTPEQIQFTGTHTYFTNEENRDAIAFTVHIETNGRIWVEPK
jgi:hypothetical protein